MKLRNALAALVALAACISTIAAPAFAAGNLLRQDI